MQQLEVGAAVDQSVAVVVGGKHPVRSGGSVWRCEGTRESSEPILSSGIKLQSSSNLCRFAINQMSLLSKKETSSLAGSEASFAVAEPLMESMVPLALKETKGSKVLAA